MKKIVLEISCKNNCEYLMCFISPIIGSFKWLRREANLSWCMNIVPSIRFTWKVTVFTDSNERKLYTRIILIESKRLAQNITHPICLTGPYHLQKLHMIESHRFFQHNVLSSRRRLLHPFHVCSSG